MPYPRDTAVSIAPESQLTAIVYELAERHGAAYVERVLLPGALEAVNCTERGELPERIREPYWGLHAFLKNYAFVKRGKDSANLSHAASVALRRLCAPEEFHCRLQSENSDTLQALALSSYNEAHGKKIKNGAFALILSDAWSLCSELHETRGNASWIQWIEHEIRSSGNLERTFNRLVQIRGVGPKAASAFLRDAVCLLDIESKLAPDQRHFAQPVDRWLRSFITLCFAERDGELLPDWVVAGKTCKLARLAGTSAIHLNYGVSSYGRLCVLVPERLANCLDQLADALEEQAKAI